MQIFGAPLNTAVIMVPLLDYSGRGGANCTSEMKIVSSLPAPPPPPPPAHAHKVRRHLSLLLCSVKGSEAKRTRPSWYKYTLRGLRHVTSAYTLKSYCRQQTSASQLCTQGVSRLFEVLEGFGNLGFPFQPVHTPSSEAADSKQALQQQAQHTREIPTRLEMF